MNQGYINLLQAELYRAADAWSRTITTQAFKRDVQPPAPNKMPPRLILLPPSNPDDVSDVAGYRPFLTPEGRLIRRRRIRQDVVSDGPDTPMASEEATRAYDAVIEPPLSRLPIQITPGPAGPVRRIRF